MSVNEREKERRRNEEEWSARSAHVRTYIFSRRSVYVQSTDTRAHLDEHC